MINNKFSEKPGFFSRHQLGDYLLITIGFMLSPLSWWNDVVVNVPLAYLFSLPFSFFSDTMFLPSFLLGYWLSNLLGFLLMHWGGEGLISHQRPNITVRRSVIVSVLYSIVMIILVLLGWIPTPSELLR